MLSDQKKAFWDFLKNNIDDPDSMSNNAKICIGKVSMMDVTSDDMEELISMLATIDFADPLTHLFADDPELAVETARQLAIVGYKDFDMGGCKDVRNHYDSIYVLRTALNIKSGIATNLQAMGIEPYKILESQLPVGVMSDPGNNETYYFRPAFGKSEITCAKVGDKIRVVGISGIEIFSLSGIFTKFLDEKLFLAYENEKMGVPVPIRDIYEVARVSNNGKRTICQNHCVLGIGNK